MRLWSLHPQHLDTKGLVAWWREGLLALNVLLNKTQGYRHHPQLLRFQNTSQPAQNLSNYLHFLVDEAEKRHYKFQRIKLLSWQDTSEGISISKGQLEYEFLWLKQKLSKRAAAELYRLQNQVSIHPYFQVIEGEIALWEKVILNAKVS